MKREAKELAQEMEIVGLLMEVMERRSASCATLSLIVDGSLDVAGGFFGPPPPPFCFFPFFLLVDFFFGGMVTIRKTTMPLLLALHLPLGCFVFVVRGKG